MIFVIINQQLATGEGKLFAKISTSGFDPGEGPEKFQCPEDQASMQIV